MKFNQIVKGAVAVAGLVVLSGCTELYSQAELDKFHNDIHARLATGSSYSSYSYNGGYAPVGTVVSRTVTPVSSTVYSASVVDSNGCGPDEHLHDSRPYCHGHQNGFVTTTLPSDYVLPWDGEKSHSHSHTHPHHGH